MITNILLTVAFSLVAFVVNHFALVSASRSRQPVRVKGVRGDRWRN